MTPKPDAQSSFDERVVDNTELEQTLEDRERAKGAAGEARAKYRTLDELVRGKIEELELADDDVVRVGRFRIKKSKVAPREVAFSTDPAERLTITPDKDE